MSAGLYVNDGGVTRKIKKLYTNVGGVTRELKELWVNDGGVNRKVFSSVPRFSVYELSWDGNVGTVSKHQSGGTFCVVFSDNVFNAVGFFQVLLQFDVSFHITKITHQVHAGAVWNGHSYVTYEPNDAMYASFVEFHTIRYCTHHASGSGMNTDLGMAYSITSRNVNLYYDHTKNDPDSMLKLLVHWTMAQRPTNIDQFIEIETEEYGTFKIPY